MMCGMADGSYPTADIVFLNSKIKVLIPSDLIT